MASLAFSALCPKEIAYNLQPCGKRKYAGPLVRKRAAFQAKLFHGGILRCMTEESPDTAETSGSVQKEQDLVREPMNISESAGTPEVPTKKLNKLIAVASVAAALGLFAASHGIGGGPGLSALAENAIPYEEALGNGRPTVVEFYADWCEVCRELAPDVYKIEQEYKDRVNFVMLNVDNSKWEPELDEFGVEGIPHFSFLDSQGNEEGNIVGRLPKKYFLENVVALAWGESSVPHSRVIGKFSSADQRQTPPLVEPRSHSQT